MIFVSRSLAVFAVALVLPAEVGGAKPCWQQVIDDWIDNARVDGTYAVQCYRDALANLPEDMRAYSSAPDDIERAMREAIRRLEEQSEAPASPAVSGDDDEDESQPPPPQTAEPKRKKEKTARETGAQAFPREPDPGTGALSSGGPFTAALDEIGPNDARSFPLPLLALGGLALVLILAAAVGLVARRLGR
jgi:hypothetical protein